MRTITQHLTQLTTIAALAAAGFTMQAAHAAPNKEVRVIQLPTVVVTAPRLRVIQLERVVITAKRLAPANNTVVAQRAARVAPV